MTRFGVLASAEAGVAAVRSYTMMRNRFSSVTTTSFRTGSTAMELNAGYGSWMNRSGCRAAAAMRAFPSGSCAPATPDGA